MADLLTGGDRDAALRALAGWRFDPAANAITRSFRFTDFSEAFGFMARVALAAEAAGHHPDWSNVYSKVTVTLSTHDAGGVTQKDIDLAAAIDRIATA